MKVPEEINNELISMFLGDKSEEEIIKLSGLSKDRVRHVLSELDSPENENMLSYVIAIKYGKDGRDTKQYDEILDANKILVQYGVLPKVSFHFITNMAVFSLKTGFGTDLLVSLSAAYNKSARYMSVKTHQDVEKRKLQLLQLLNSLRVDVKELQQRYTELTKNSLPKKA